MWIFQSCTVWVFVSLAEAEVCPCSVFPVVHSVHWATFLNTPEYLDWVQWTAVCYRRSSSPDKHVIKSFSQFLDPAHAETCQSMQWHHRGFYCNLRQCGRRCMQASQRQLGCTYFSCRKAGRKYSDVGGWANKENSKVHKPKGLEQSGSLLIDCSYLLRWCTFEIRIN